MTQATIKRIAVLTSGGDSSGMNPCIRAVVRTACYHHIEVDGIYHGYRGMIEDKFKSLSSRDVGGLSARGGTILGSARCREFHTVEGRQKAIANLKKHKIDALVVIGGDGSFYGAEALSQESDIPVIGLPGTIDNDIAGTDYTIGYDTAVNVAMDAIDKIRDTANSHERIFFVEVMGRNAGYIALESGLAAGAEQILVPEGPTDVKMVADELLEGRRLGKMSSIVVVAEGDDQGGAFDIAEKISHYANLPTRVTVLGHLQRGGSPTANDRLLATRLGYASVMALMDGQRGVMLGIVNNKVLSSSLTEREKAPKVCLEEFEEIRKAMQI